MKGRLLLIYDENFFITYELLVNDMFITFFNENNLYKYVNENNINILSVEEVKN